MKLWSLMTSHCCLCLETLGLVNDPTQSHYCRSKQAGYHVGCGSPLPLSPLYPLGHHDLGTRVAKGVRGILQLHQTAVGDQRNTKWELSQFHRGNWVGMCSRIYLIALKKKKPCKALTLDPPFLWDQNVRGGGSLFSVCRQKSKRLLSKSWPSGSGDGLRILHSDI